MKTGAAGRVFAIILAASGAARGQQKQITAREVVARIQQQVGLPWKTDTVDTFKAGNPDSAVRGIAVTMMATMDVLERAAAEGLNFVITHEPTFYSHLDTPEGLQEVSRKLNSPVVRVVGDPRMRVTKVAFSPGAAGFQTETQALERDDVQVLMVGETREWETVEYAADAATEGRNKALIVIGHIPSEQAGMEECARWLRGFVKNVPVALVPAKHVLAADR